jgi:uncharacterized MnhB-related membrane protein
MMHVVEMIAPGVTDGGARTSDAISMKNVLRCWLVCSCDGGAAAIVTWTLMQATDVAIGTNKVLTNVVPIMHTADCATTDVEVRQSAAKSFATAAAALDNITVFQIDPDTALDVDGGYDCLYVMTSGANAGNLLSVVALCEMRYEGDTVPTVITD